MAGDARSGLRLEDLCRDVESHSEGRIRPEILGDPAQVVTGIADNSTRVTPGDLFVCIRGERHDGHEFLAAAVQAGAVAAVVDHPLEIDCPQILVADTRVAVGEFAAAVHGYPSEAMTVIGITGTNGKTTTAQLVAAMLAGAGQRVQVMGTLSGSMTTPEAVDLQAALATWRSEGIDAVVMEVSSHALALHRVDGTRFALTVFTNLGRDHLDLHGTMEAYFRAKARLFTPQFCTRAVINTMDLHGALLADSVDIEVTPVNPRRLEEVVVEVDRIRGVWGTETVSVALGGHTNLTNLWAALEVADVLEIDAVAAARGLAAMPRVPGRFEVITADARRGAEGPTVIVDFAHTPDGLSELLGSVRSLGGRGRLLLVFGCGGDRDREKRPQMGKVAVEGADLVMITADNPRSEDPARIAEDILAGIAEEDRPRVQVHPDRSEAIGRMLRAAQPGDVVIVAGKGHERTQTIGDTRVPFDDAEVVRWHLAHPQEECR